MSLILNFSFKKITYNAVSHHENIHTAYDTDIYHKKVINICKTFFLIR